RRRFFLVGLDQVHLDHFRVLEQGTVTKLAPDAPVEAGQELELKLGEVGLYDARAGVGKVDGIDVTVAEAAKLVGKKVRVRITAVQEGGAYAELVDAVEQHEPPITAEGEAEKPTRAPRAKKAVAEEAAAADAEADTETEAGEEAPGPAGAAPAEPLALPAEEPEQKAPAPVIHVPERHLGEPSEDGATPAPTRKRTRRGTRGGRNR